MIESAKALDEEEERVASRAQRLDSLNCSSASLPVVHKALHTPLSEFRIALMSGVCVIHDVANVPAHDQEMVQQLGGFRVRVTQTCISDVLFSQAGTTVAFLYLIDVTPDLVSRVSALASSFKQAFVLISPSLTADPETCRIVNRFASCASLSFLPVPPNVSFTSHALSIATATINASAQAKEWATQQEEAVQCSEAVTSVLEALPWSVESEDAADQATTLRMLGSICHISACRPSAFEACTGVDAATAAGLAAFFHTPMTHGA